jgi:hypothetical protein
VRYGSFFLSEIFVVSCAKSVFARSGHGDPAQLEAAFARRAQTFNAISRVRPRRRLGEVGLRLLSTLIAGYKSRRPIQTLTVVMGAQKRIRTELKKMAPVLEPKFTNNGLKAV